MSHATIIRTCRECDRDFEITPEEQAFLADIFRRNGQPFTPPSRCTPCRKFRRQQQYGEPPAMVPDADITIICRDCQTPFVFERGEQVYFAERNFSPPSRCRPCRTVRRRDSEVSCLG
jgi:hypothetical protein